MSCRYHLHQINKVVDYLDENLQSPVICFEGSLGAGKTTLISRLCQKWQVSDSVNSPTFSIVNNYNSANKGLIYHFDFFRLESLEEALDIGIEEYLDSGNICLIEWSEKIFKLLPENYTRVNIEINNDQSRSINIVSL
tara:strand:+ start:1841 stop:2254 length:414 start_codon:yes stop_codon:yes gene_type:complete